MRFLILAAVLCASSLAWAGQHELNGRAETRFSPHGGCTEMLIAAIDGAHSDVWVMAYGFTSTRVADALLRARERGISLHVLLDRSNLAAPKGQGPRLEQAGVDVIYDCKHPIAHDKLLVIDGDRFTVGSFNFTESAEKNAENLSFITDAPWAKDFIEHWLAHAAHSLPRDKAMAAKPARSKREAGL